MPIVRFQAVFLDLLVVFLSMVALLFEQETLEETQKLKVVIAFSVYYTFS